jgi:hypothetical protein
MLNRQGLERYRQMTQSLGLANYTAWPIGYGRYLEHLLNRLAMERLEDS